MSTVGTNTFMISSNNLNGTNLAIQNNGSQATLNYKDGSGKLIITPSIDMCGILDLLV